MRSKLVAADYAALALAGLIAAVGLFVESPFIWGADAAAALPASVRVLAIVAALGVAGALAWLARRAPTLPPVTRANDRATELTWLAVSFALFWALRAATLLDGDGLPVVASLIQPGTPPPLEAGTAALHRLVDSAWRPLASALHIGAFQRAWLSVAFVSCASGALAVVVTRRLALRWLGERGARGPALALVALACAFSQGHVLVFLGHVENYAPVACAMVVFVLLAHQALAGERSLMAPTLALVVAALLHLMALALVPAWLVLLVAAARGAPRRVTPRESFAVAAIVAAGVGLAALLSSTGGGRGAIGFVSAVQGLARSAIAPFASPEALTRKPVHVANAWALLGPWCFFAALALVPGALRPRRASALDRFDAAVAGATLALSLVVGPSNLGYARNWDVLAPLACVLSVAVVSLLVRAREPDALRPLLVGVVAVSLLHTAPFVAVNMDEGAAMRRFAALPLPPGDRASTLGLWSAVRGRTADAERWWRQGLAAEPTNVRLLLFMGRLELERSSFAPAAAFYQRARIARPDLLAPLAGQALALVLSGHAADARTLARTHAREHPRSPAGWAVLAALAHADSAAAAPAYADSANARGPLDAGVLRALRAPGAGPGAALATLRMLAARGD